MAPPRKPSSKKLLRGTLRRDRTPRPPSVSAPQAPRAPAGLSKLARREWKKLAPLAHALGTLTPVDVRAFSLLCEVLATTIEAADAVRQDGFLVENSSGGRRAHPALRALEAARVQASKLLASFGLTPVGRNLLDVEIKLNFPEPGGERGIPSLDEYLASHPGRPMPFEQYLAMRPRPKSR